MSFEGWPEAALDFYDGLEEDNSKAYWMAHRDIYETCVLAPMAELLAELEPEHGETKIYRPYRDVRFSKDKSPYKTAIAAHAGDGYIQLSAAGLAVGSGLYVMASDQLERYRTAVAAESSGAELEQIIAGLRKHDIEVQGRESLKSAPRGYPTDHPRAELLRHKGLFAWKEWPVEPWLATPAAKAKVADFLVATRPFGQWLTLHVGSAAETAGRGR